jgi:glutamine synthetase
MLSMFNGDGSPYMGDPRHVLKQVLSLYQEAGWRPVVAAELEFSLVRWDDSQPGHTCPSLPGNSPVGGNTYGLDVLNHNQAMLEDLRLACELQDLPYDGVVKESAPSQYEINMHHVDNPVLAAKQIIMMKRLIKGVAGKHGLIASFMPKPFEDEAGNGMHVHCSVLDEKGVNIFDDGTELGTPLLHNAIGGCLQHMAESVAIFAPSYNAYRRFQPGCHAPTFPSWGGCQLAATTHGASSTVSPARMPIPTCYLRYCSQPCGRVSWQTCRRANPLPGMATPRRRNSCRCICLTR